ncbi:MAG: hypothetical protein ACLQT7_04795 [Candidatus Dormibacteria bacterium]
MTEIFPRGSTVAERIRMYTEAVMSVPLAAIPAEIDRLEEQRHDAGLSPKASVALAYAQGLLRDRLKGKNDELIREQASGYAEVIAR